jgi:hypothetical protein
VVWIEDFGFPVPPPDRPDLAAVYAGSGQLNIVLMALLASVALS